MHPSSVLPYLGALGGAVVFLGALGGVIRGIFRQVGATEANTTALTELTAAFREATGKLADHETRISRLEGRKELRSQ